MSECETGYLFIYIISGILMVIGIISILFKLYANKEVAVVYTSLLGLITFLSYQILKRGREK